jgi:anti-sigma factor RsiW
MLDERTEHLITRRLDGELGEGEALELDKRLIRAPEARHALEELERIDHLAQAALGSLLAEPSGPASTPARPAHRPWLSRRSGLNLMAGAVAAALLLAFTGPWRAPQRTSERSPVKSGVSLDAAMLARASMIPAVSDGSDTEPDLIELIDGPRRHRERVNQNVVGVFDPETDTIYVLELNTARTTVSPFRADY